MLTPIPFFDIQAQHQPIRHDIEQAIARVLDSGRFIRGPFVEAFEAEIADYLGIGHAIGVSSGTDALLAALMALEIGPGDEVITTAFTFCASAEVILRVGATPVFVDIDPQTFLIDADRIEDAITDKTRAILPVHLFGQACDMDRIMAIARRHNLRVIEDCAQSMGATFAQKQTGTFGDVGCFSFFPTKNLGALGDGGLITTSDADLAQKIRDICNHGCPTKYSQQIIGGNFRLDALQAAVLSAKLPHLERWIAQRRQLAHDYHAALQQLPGVTPPREAPNRRHTYNQYTVRSADRRALQNHLDRAQIAHAIYYPIPLHHMPPYQSAPRIPHDLPHTTQASNQALSLPIITSADHTLIQRLLHRDRQ